jgi:transposase
MSDVSFPEQRPDAAQPPAETPEALPRAGGFDLGADAQAVPDDTLDPQDEAPDAGAGPSLPPLARSRQRRRVLAPPAAKTPPLSPEQRLLLLDTWQRSGLPAADFAALVGLSKYTLYQWKKKFEAEGPAGLMDKPKGSPAGSRLPEVTKRTILMLKQANPDWGCQRISDMLLRGPALPASAAAVAKVLHEAGYALEEVPTRPHPPREQRFERARPNSLWQTDLFTFILDHTS